MSEKNKIGAKVKLVRENRKLSIEDVSERTNLPPAQIQSIEDGSLVPNLTPLIKIARVLGVRLGTFMDDDENLGPVVTRAQDKKEVTRFSSYTSPVIQVVKYIDTEEQSGSVMYDLYIDGKREQRYDIQGLLYRLELMFRTAGFKKGES